MFKSEKLIFCFVEDSEAVSVVKCFDKFSTARKRLAFPEAINTAGLWLRRGMLVVDAAKDDPWPIAIALIAHGRGNDRWLQEDLGIESEHVLQVIGGKNLKDSKSCGLMRLFGGISNQARLRNYGIENPPEWFAKRAANQLLESFVLHQLLRQPKAAHEPSRPRRRRSGAYFVEHPAIGQEMVEGSVG